MPLVSVLIPIYNAQEFLVESVQSVLNQTFQDFELILVDDASTDNSFSILQTISDSRLKIIHHNINMGIGGALNSALASAKGKYLLRMDADDIAFPNRIALQVEFMENHPEIGISGTLVEYFDGTPFNRIVQNDYLKPSLLLDCPFAHPSVIIRKEIMDKNGLQFSGYLEDYELWIKLSQLTEFGLLPEVLLKYRKSENQFTSQNFEKRQDEANRLRISFAEKWLKRILSPTERLIVSVGIDPNNQPDLKSVEIFCNELLQKDPWSQEEAVFEVIKKLFLRNFYRAPKEQKDVSDLMNISFFSIRERFNLIKKASFSSIK